MRDLELGRVVRALRRRRGWRQSDCADRAGLHRSTWSLLERGQLDRVTLGTLRRCLDVLGVRLDLVPRWRGADLDRLLDELHAQLAAAWKRRLERWGWLVRVEVSYSRYGERGRVDLLAWFAPLRILLVVEIKTEIADAQALLGGLDAKARLGPFLARQVGWPTPAMVVPALIVAEGSTGRRHVGRLEPLFAHLSRRGRAAVSWLHRPDASPGGVLLFSDLSHAHGGSVRRLGRSRVRLSAARSSVSGSPIARPNRPAPPNAATVRR